MNILFAGKTFDARVLETYVSQCKPGDVIDYAGVLFEIETVQSGCPDISTNKVFTNVVMRDATRARCYSRSIFGKVQVYRRKS
jgi:hypothetical protein